MKKMPISAIERTSITKLSFFIFIICIFISLKNQNADTKRRFTSTSSMAAINYFSSTDTSFISPDAFSSDSLFLSDENDMSRAVDPPPRSLEYDFYRDSCTGAEQKIRSVVTELYRLNSSVAPALLRLAFHDCFIQGCDASILLDPAEGIESEKDSPPNQSLKGFNVMDIIKSQIEEACPGVVSCSDILVLAARDGVVLAGGPFYPLCTGRRDSHVSFMDAATYDLPAPNADLPETLASFASRGFDERETVSLLGAHSIGVIHCKFYQNRLYNFAGTVKPDPSLDPELLKELRSKCIPSQRTTSPAPSP
ncbi:putative Peroxidase 48, partial [Carica papaya]|uniref:putative Peroxidase 48 n=1 Tax=Carica papaya TaxID=3649 RepID=UPI000B8CCA42